MALQSSPLPVRKVLAGGLASLAGLAAGWALKRYAGMDVPADAAVAAVSSVATLAAYLIPPHARDAIVHLDAEVRAMGADDPHDARGQP